MAVEGIELGGSDMCTSRRSEQREGSQIRANDVPVRSRFWHRDLRALTAGLTDVVGRPVGFRTAPNVSECGLPIERVVVRNLGDKRRFGSATSLFERGVDDDIAAEVCVLKAIDNGIAREVVGFVVEDLLEPFGNLAANVRDPVGGGDIVVFGSVEHFDGFGVVGADVLVNESTDL